MSDLKRRREIVLDSQASEGAKKDTRGAIREQAYHALIDARAFVLISVPKDGKTLQFDTLMPGPSGQPRSDTVLKFLTTAAEVWREGQAQQESMNGEEARP